MKKSKHEVYMLVTPDKYELPLMVCDTMKELARKSGTTPEKIYSAMWKAKNRGSRTQYVRVPVDEDE